MPSALAELLGLEMQRQLFGADRVRRTPTLIPVKRDDTPPPDPVGRVPRKYLELVGHYPDHPGEGLGPGAKQRRQRSLKDAAIG